MRRSLARRSFLASVPMGPPDPILGLGMAFKQDPAPNKVNLAVGVYRDDDGKPYVLECVKRAGVSYTDMEYAPITGLPGFVTHAQRLAFGEVPAMKQGRLASSQALSGTGALRIAGAFINRFFGGKTLSLPTPTWGNHANVFRDSGVGCVAYRYYDAATNGVDFKGMCDDIGALPSGSVVLLHACAHNPTGCDLTVEQWRQLRELVKAKQLVPLFDAAYLGFASGSLDNDRAAIELFSDIDGTMVCQSMAKNFGLYGQRVGAVHVVCKDSDERERVLSQIKILIRPMYSNPPIHGARVVETIMDSDELRTLWMRELRSMAQRMNGVRQRLVEELQRCGSQRDWTHITKQIGMMAYTGLSKAQVESLRTQHHVYMTGDGRAAITGLNTSNVQYVAEAFHQVTK